MRIKLTETWKRDAYVLIGCILIGIFISVLLAILAFVGYVIYCSIQLKNNKKKQAEDYNRIIYEEFLLFGPTKEERERNIKKMFEENKASISFATWYDYKGWNGQAWVPSSLTFKITRNLAAMEPKEREFLRTTLLLFNAGTLSEVNYSYYLFALVNGNGKASVDTWSYKNNYDNYNDGPSTVKFYQDKTDGSVDSAINWLLKRLQEMKQSDSAPKEVAEIMNRIHGGGAWFTHDDIQGSVFNSNGNGKYKLNLGHIDDHNLLDYSGEGSLITIAPPGSGKTQCFVLPNMLSWEGAAVVLDIKGEIYASTSKWRSENVGKVYKFSPLDPANSNSYNPLVFIRQDGDYIWEDSRFLADMMIVPSGASDPFWENMARDVLTAAIAYVSFTNDPDDRPMSKVLDLIYGLGWDEMVSALKTNMFVSAMRQTGHALGEMEKKQRDSVLKTAQSSLSAWQGERISKVTKKSDWSPMDLRNGNPTIYICINPNEIDSYLSVLRVFIAQHIRMLTNELPPRGAAPVLFMLDELPRLKKMPPVDEALNIGRQYGIKLWMFAQSYGQLKEAYTNPEGLIGSCVVRTYMNVPLNDELATKLSDWLGTREGPLDASQKKLVEPLELAGPGYRDLILVLATNTKPAKIRKKFAWENEELKSRIGQLQMNNHG